MLRKILLGLTLLVGGFVLLIASRPGTMRIERSTKVSAPASIAFAQVNDFHRWDAWSPWAKLDPKMEQKHEGSPSGQGAAYWWSSSQDDVGEGRMTITESRAPEHIAIKLEFLKPWQATHDVTFTFKGEGDSTAVTWTMEGKNNFVMKAFAMFADIDAMVGKDFEKGLSSMKVVAEAEAHKIATEAQAKTEGAVEAAP